MPCLTLTLLEPGRGLAALRARGRNLLWTLAIAVMVRAERRALMRLDDSALKDMGFNTGQAQCEASRAFWDLPPERLAGSAD